MQRPFMTSSEVGASAGLRRYGCSAHRDQQWWTEDRWNCSWRAFVPSSRAAAPASGPGSRWVVAAEGAIVGVHGRDAQRCRAVVDGIRSAGGDAHALLGDLASEEGTAAVADAAESALGGVDVLVNNVGGKTTQGNPSWFEISWADWLGTYEQNVGAAVRLVHRFVPGMRERWVGTGHPDRQRFGNPTRAGARRVPGSQGGHGQPLRQPGALVGAHRDHGEHGDPGDDPDACGRAVVGDRRRTTGMGRRLVRDRAPVHHRVDPDLRRRPRAPGGHRSRRGPPGQPVVQLHHAGPTTVWTAANAAR